MFKHLLPNAMVATLTFLPFIINGSIATLTSSSTSSASRLPPGSPSLGELLAQGKANLQAPWLGLAGFFVIAIMLSLLIFIGEAVRDAFDRGRRSDEPMVVFASRYPMNKIVREHYPVDKLPEDLRELLDPSKPVTLVIEQDDEAARP